MEAFPFDMDSEIPQIYPELCHLETQTSYEHIPYNIIIKQEKTADTCLDMLCPNNSDPVIEQFFMEYNEKDPIINETVYEYNDNKILDELTENNETCEKVVDIDQRNINCTKNDFRIWYSHMRGDIFVIKRDQQQNNKSILKKKCNGKLFDITELLTMKQKDVGNLLGISKCNLCKKFRIATRRRWPYREHKKMLRLIKNNKNGNNKKYLKRIDLILAPTIIKL